MNIRPSYKQERDYLMSAWLCVCLAGWCTGAGGPRLRHLALPPAAAAAGDYAASPVLVPGQSSHRPALLQPICRRAGLCDDCPGTSTGDAA